MLIFKTTSYTAESFLMDVFTIFPCSLEGEVVYEAAVHSSDTHTLRS